jgi:hypothetical protein
MFEGYKPTVKGIEIIRDYLSERISFSDFVELAKEKAYA